MKSAYFSLSCRCLNGFPARMLYNAWYSLAIVMTMWSTVAAADELLWFDQNRPTSEAWQAIAILAAAGDEGLKAENFRAEALHTAFTDAEKDPAATNETIALLDRELSTVMHRYLVTLHSGQVDPRLIQENFTTQRASGFDPASLLQAAVKEHRLADAVASAAPALPLYGKLREALAHYRSLAADPAVSALWQKDLPSLPNKKLEPGQSYLGLPQVSKRLVALGDLKRTTSSTHYAGFVVEGIKAFQTRHGLTPDGVIGVPTFERLMVSPATRAGQIELAMERLRWLPLLQSPRMIVVNVPEHILEGYEVRDGNIDVKVTMRVIIGKAPDMRTPLFDEDLRFVEFSPYWNVPPTIARSEVIPAVLRNPGYFDQQGFEFVGRDGQISTALSMDHLDAVQHGQMRIRQRPGPKNALGDIKFAFPNKDNIYLHHTQTPRLFKKDRRDLSHGCIRVEEPLVLAKFVLQNDPTWGETRIREAMEKKVSMTVRLHEPLRVVIAYNTVVVKNDGLVYFFQDIYGQDNKLDEALRRSALDNHAVSYLTSGTGLR